MANSGASAVHEIQRDLACPQCQYNLRGLRGAIVNCPECGLACDVAKLIAARWEKPWYTAPMFNHLALPVAWGIGWCWLSLLIILPGRVGIMRRQHFSPALLMVVWAGFLLAWLGTMYYVRKRWGSWQGAYLALLAHFVVAGYIVSVIGFVISVMALWNYGGDLLHTAGVLWTQALLGVITWLLVLAAVIAMVYFCRRVERYMAGQCIKRYLARQSMPAEEG